MNGKSKCRILKDIRRKIARENDIEYVTSECKFQGSCSGTCPKCEAEVRYLEAELRKRQKAGKAVAVAGIAAAMVVTAAGCDLFEKSTMGDVETTGFDEETTAREATELITAGVILLEGEVPDGTAETTLPPTGELEVELTGDVAWPE